jgi:Histidine kinase-, DNA gyrase B-, and HSP90-like ATPase
MKVAFPLKSGSPRCNGVPLSALTLHSKVCSEKREGTPSGSNRERSRRDWIDDIPQEVKEKMSNPFFTTKPAGEGTGLGLSISHDIVVKQHAGSIEVDTQLGEFTEIRIILPRSAAHLSGKRA